MKKVKNLWLYIISISLTALIIAEVYSDHLISSSSSTNQQMKISAAGVAIGAILTTFLSAIGVVKTKKVTRFFAIFSCLVSVVIFGFAFFAYGFIGYGTN